MPEQVGTGGFAAPLTLTLENPDNQTLVNPDGLELGA
jgi:hypothetical protein